MLFQQGLGSDKGERAATPVLSKEYPPECIWQYDKVSTILFVLVVLDVAGNLVVTAVVTLRPGQGRVPPYPPRGSHCRLCGSGHVP